MYKGSWCFLLYFLALVLLILGICPHTGWDCTLWQVHWTVWAMAALFLAWDAGFVFGWKWLGAENSFAERTTKEILGHCRDAETLMSYFIAFYAAVLAVVFTDDSKTKAFLAACEAGHVPMYLTAVPLVLAAIPMLFIPVQFGKKKNQQVQNSIDEISWGVKMVLFVNIYCEKLVVFTLVHSLLRIATAIPLRAAVGAQVSTP